MKKSPPKSPYIAQKIKLLGHGTLCRSWTALLLLLSLFLPAGDRTPPGTGFLVSFESVLSELEQVR